MLMIRFGILVLVLTVVSWLVLKVLRRPAHFGLVFLFWVLVVMVVVTGFYGISVWVSGLNNF